MSFGVGTKFTISNSETVRREFRGQRCTVIEEEENFYHARLETGESINSSVRLRKTRFGHTYKLYVKNKGGWIF